MVSAQQKIESRPGRLKLVVDPESVTIEEHLPFFAIGLLGMDALLD
jgi:hypothetical protein